jgi:hypothetical protein
MEDVITVPRVVSNLGGERGEILTWKADEEIDGGWMMVGVETETTMMRIYNLWVIISGRMVVV